MVTVETGGVRKSTQIGGSPALSRRGGLLEGAGNEGKVWSCRIKTARSNMMADITTTKDTADVEPEITPEMVNAGLEKLYEFPITDPWDEKMKEAVAQVFLAMIRARP